MVETRLEWTEFKEIIDAKALRIDYRSLPKDYKLDAFDGPQHYTCWVDRLPSGEETSEQLDFEANYKDNANKPTPKLEGLDAQFNVDISTTKVDLPRANQAYAEIYKYDGIGRLVAMIIKFNSDNVMVKLSIDEKQVFELDCGFLEDLSPSSGDSFEIPGINWSRTKNMLIFKPIYPISYASQVKVECRANSNSSSRDMQQYHIHIAKDK